MAEPSIIVSHKRVRPYEVTRHAVLLPVARLEIDLKDRAVSGAQRAKGPSKSPEGVTGSQPGVKPLETETRMGVL